MSQTITVDQRQSDPPRDLEPNADEVRTPVQGDFARGQRHGVAVGHSDGDFATGMRHTSMLGVTGDFATGMRTSRRQTTLGDFATGMRTLTAPVVVERFPSRLEELALAA
jgi:hypothetical protein